MTDVERSAYHATDGSHDHARLASRVQATLRAVPDFPSAGIVFQDITPILADAPLFSAVIDAMGAPFSASRVTHVAAMESRGFLFGAPLALRLGAAFVPLRKPGKLPAATVQERYALEYGQDALEMHRDAFVAGSRVLIVDDVLATGGTAAAACRLTERQGATIVGVSLLLEIAALNGRAALAGRRVESLLAI